MDLKELLKNTEELLQINLLGRFEDGDSIKKMYEDFTACGKDEASKIFLKGMKETHPKYTDDELIISIRTAKAASNAYFVTQMMKIHELLKKEKDRKEIADCLRNIANNLESIKGDITNE